MNGLVAVNAPNLVMISFKDEMKLMGNFLKLEKFQDTVGVFMF
jgi:hypothetical protein